MERRAERCLLGLRMRGKESPDPRLETAITAAGLCSDTASRSCRRQLEAGMKELLLAIVIVMFVAHYCSSVRRTPPAGPVESGGHALEQPRACDTPSHASPWRASVR